MNFDRIFASIAQDAASVSSVTTGVFDSTGYDYIVAGVKHEGADTTLTPSDNSESGDWVPLTKQRHANNDLGAQLFWAKIGNPNSGHTFTVTYGAARTFTWVGVWLISSSGRAIQVVAEASKESNTGTPNTADLAGSGLSILINWGGLYASRTTTAGIGWTLDTSGSNARFGQSMRVSGGTYTPSATLSSSTNWSSVSAAFSLIDQSSTLGPAFIKRPWTKQPPAGVGVTGFLAPDVCLFVQDANTSHREVLHSALPNSDGVVREVDGMRHTGSGDTGVLFDPLVGVNPSTKGAMTFYIRDLGTSSDGNMLFEMLGVSGTRIFSASINSKASEIINIKYDSTGQNYTFVGVFDGGGHWITLNYDANASGVQLDQEPWIDGLLPIERSEFTGTPIPGDMDTLDICQDATATAASLADGTIINNIMFHSRWLKGAEIKSLHANPWQIFKPHNIFVGKPDALNQRLVRF